MKDDEIAADEVYIDVATDFSATPGGRYTSESLYSGQEFRETLLEPRIAERKRLVVNLDGPEGFTTSFLEEAFGGLVRKFGTAVVDRVRFIAKVRPNRARKAREYMTRAVNATTRT
jgi:hypothetical protein